MINWIGMAIRRKAISTDHNPSKASDKALLHKMNK